MSAQLTSDTGLAAAIQALIAAAPGAITINSGLRTRAEQQALYDKYMAGKGAPAAKPGHSLHEQGLAADLHFADAATRQWAHDHAAQYGLSFPLGNEPWHVEMASARKGGKVSAQSSTTPTTTTAPKADTPKVATDYGYATAFFNSDPSLKKLLKDTLAGDWTVEKFSAELRNTTWYKTHTEAQRKWVALNTGDHAEAKRQVDAKTQEVLKQAQTMGATLTGLEAHDLAVNVLSKGLTDAEVAPLIGAHVHFVRDKDYGGQAGKNQDVIKTTASSYGVEMSQDQVARWVKDLATGTKTDEDFDNWVKMQAKLLYPGLAPYIDKGLSVDDMAENYKTKMAATLELSSDQIKANDPLIQKALQYRDPASKDAGQPMPLWQFESLVKSDPRWLKTGNAMNSFANVTHQVLTNFGLVY